MRGISKYCAMGLAVTLLGAPLSAYAAGSAGTAGSPGDAGANGGAGVSASGAGGGPSAAGVGSANNGGAGKTGGSTDCASPGGEMAAKPNCQVPKNPGGG